MQKVKAIKIVFTSTTRPGEVAWGLPVDECPACIKRSDGDGFDLSDSRIITDPDDAYCITEGGDDLLKAEWCLHAVKCTPEGLDHLQVECGFSRVGSSKAH